MKPGSANNSLFYRLPASCRFLLFSIIFFTACGKNKRIEHPVFTVLEEQETGIHFKNRLSPSPAFNALDYMYYYNGAGVGAGDFNKDGYTDLFFASNQGRNALYINVGSMHFTDVTAEAAIPDDGGWSTGVSVVDINNDGLLDIYVCRVGNYLSLQSRNQLLVCQGIGQNKIPYYKDEAKKYGLDFSGFSTQAAFLDYDMDGDLDMFLLNHAVHHNGSFAPRADFIGTYSELSGDRLYRNDGNKFTDATHESGINSSSISYGLGITVSDINLDGWPDIYVGNDFHENDYLYINQHNGKFTDESTRRMMHTSKFSMGVDIADINNDGYPEIISMDMLAEDPLILKSSLGDDDYNLFYEKIAMGYSYQYARNNLQLNRRNGLFSETGLYSGVAASDWSWAPLFFDFDNDGLKDLFISNGIPKRLNDIDYLNYISADETQQLLRDSSKDERNLELIKKFPEIKLPNKFYHNNGSLSFADVSDSIGNSKPTYSNGAAYADLDNDGDLDMVVNNIDDQALVYRNNSPAPVTTASTEINLTGPPGNINATGTKIILFTGDGIRSYEKTPVRGFLSSMETPLHIGTRNIRIDSAFLVWSDNTYERLQLNGGANKAGYVYKTGMPAFDYSVLQRFYKNNTLLVKDITATSGIDFLHKENNFHEFDREPLLPHELSSEGPALAVADIDHNGLDDIFFGSSRDQKSVIYLQTGPGRFSKTIQPALDADSSYEDTDACWADVNSDGAEDLIVASGGNEFFGKDQHNTPRVYLNDGHSHFTRSDAAFDNLFLTASSVAAEDFNKDGFVDLFIGARTVPWEYGRVPASYLLQNDGTGHFKDVTAAYAPGLAQAGFITQARWVDVDGDGTNELLLSLEWDSPVYYKYINGKFQSHALSDKKGWWNFLTPCDVNGDGNIDFIAGNLGLNSRLKASAMQPLRMYYQDFDDNGRKEQLMTYYLKGKEVPYANKVELEKQMPVIKKKFLYAKDFAKASLPGLFGKNKLSTAALFSADYFSNAIFINKGNGKFEVKALPFEAQFTTYRDAVPVDINNDNLPDILLAGNYYGNNIEMGRYDACYGLVLINKGDGNFETSQLNGLTVKGQIRHVRPVHCGSSIVYVLARNNDSAIVVSFNKQY